MKKKILIFEDEWVTIQGSFELANAFAFNDELEFEPHSKSQDVQYSTWSGYYDAVFIDITLAKNSKMDGFSIVNTIRDKKLIDFSKVVIMTGNSRVKEKLEEMGLDTNVLTVMYKPVAFDELASVLNKVLS